MPSLFWTLLTWQQAAPTLIRWTLAAVFLHWAYREFRTPGASARTKIVATIEAVAGILLVIGLWTQAAALVIVIDLIGRLIGRIQRKAFFTDGVNYYFILLVLAASLLVLGAGFFAFDLAI